MYRKEICLELISDMFSYGANQQYSEFRIPELKALLRATFREFFVYSNEQDLKEKELFLFGGTKEKSTDSINNSLQKINSNRKAPVTIRLGLDKNTDEFIKNKLIHDKKSKHKGVLILRQKPRKSIEMDCLPKKKTKVQIVLQSYSREYLNTYILLLKIGAITGGLGKRSRKGMGSFRIVNEDEQDFISFIKDIFPEQKEMNSKEEYVHKDNTYKKEKQNYALKHASINSLKKGIHLIFVDQPLGNINYANELYIIPYNGDVDKILGEISQVTHERVNVETFMNHDPSCKIYRKAKINVLGNCKGKRDRFACPIYVTLYEQNNQKYIIIKKLNYDYIYKIDKSEEKKRELLEIQDMDEKYIGEYINRILKIVGC